MSSLFDTNIVIDYINSVSQAAEVFAPQTGRTISIMSWTEVMAGAAPGTESVIRSILHTCIVVPIGAEIAERAATLRQRNTPEAARRDHTCHSATGRPYACHPQHA